MNSSVLSLLSGGLLALSMLCQAAAQPLPRRLTPPPGSVSFGSSVTVLANGNIVVTDPDWTGPGNVEKAGAVYLYDGATLELISTLTGSHAGDQVGTYVYAPGIFALPNGNFVVRSPYWNGGCGAVTWVSGTAGVPGEVSAANSLVGGRSGDVVGFFGVDVLPNGNYVVRSSKWNQSRGAVTWGSGAAGVSGVVSAANSLTGAGLKEAVGFYAVDILRNGNYAVRSPNWNEYRGAVTWGSGTAGVRGEISSSNSLTGGQPGDGVGSWQPWHLTNGNCLWFSPGWNREAGAMTFMNANKGVTGEVLASNSLVNLPLKRGAPLGDLVTELDNGNFVVLSSSRWDGPYYRQGAATWGSGATGVKGEVSAANSLIGYGLGGDIGSGGIVQLANGNFLVVTPSAGGEKGAITWADGRKGLTGVISAANSLIDPPTFNGWGVPNVSVTLLANGNFVAVYPFWNRDRGAVVWGSGLEGARGEVSDVNALTGASDYDRIARGGVTALTNGNYVLLSPFWNDSSGAATWCGGSAPVTGHVTTGNSFTGMGFRGSVTALSNGHYVVCSPSWTGKGAVTWGNGATGLTGVPSTANSLTGSRGIIPDVPSAGDHVGARGVLALSNGNYAVVSPDWWDGRGAVTWCDGSGPLAAEVSVANSLTGNSTFGGVGGPGVVKLGGDGLLVKSSFRRIQGGNYGTAALTWAGAGGLRGEVSAANSLLTSGPFDLLETSENGGVTVLPGGACAVILPNWNEGRGAVVWSGPGAGVRGEITSVNAVTGTRPGDAVGDGGVRLLDNGDFLVRSRKWNGGLGAWTWGSSAQGVRGEVSAANSHVGTRSFPMPSEFITGGDGSYAFTINPITAPSDETEPHGLFVAGDAKWGGGGYPTLWNSLRGSLRSPAVQPVTLWDRTRSRWIVRYGSGNAEVVVFDPVRVIGVSGPQGVDVRDESIPARRRGTDFGAVQVNGGRAHGFTVADAGIRRLVLTGDPPVRVTGANAAEFTVTRQPRFPFTDDAGFTFEITFKPAGPGPRAAVVSIPSNADGEGRNPYTFPVLGTGVENAREVFEDWCADHFGTAMEGTAPAEDFDSDGLSNLLEFAFDTDPADSDGGPVPLHYSGPLTAPGGDGVLAAHGIPLLVRAEPAGQDGGPPATLVWLRRRDAPGAGLKYEPQFSADLQTWHAVTAEPVVLAGDGTTEAVALPFPAGPADNDGDGGPEERLRFFRLAVTLEP